MQFLARDNFVKVIECNLRASRSFPFVSKVLDQNFIEMATRIMLGEKVEKPNKSIFDVEHIGVKASQFSFSRLTKADPVLGVDMASTGEVGCIGDDYYEAILKAMLSVGYRIPSKGVLLSTGDIKSKVELINSCRLMKDRGLQLYAAAGTSTFLESHGIECSAVHWPDEDKKPNSIDLMKKGNIDFVVNIPKNLESNELNNDYSIRRTAIDLNIPIITNARLASAYITAFCTVSDSEIKIKSWREYIDEKE